MPSWIHANVTCGFGPRPRPKCNTSRRGPRAIGTEFAARAPADGYTVLQITMTLAVKVSLYRNLPFDLVRDLAPVTLSRLRFPLAG